MEGVPPTSSQIRGWRRGLAPLSLAVLAIAACSGPPEVNPAPEGVVTLNGTVAIPIAGSPASPPSSVSQSCTGDGVLADIHEGTPIIVRNGAGSTLQDGSLGPGEITPGDEGQSCSFAFQVHDIPLGENFYTVQVADRAVRIYSADQLDAAGWDIAIAPVGAD
jgi:hypothetical protein